MHETANYHDCLFFLIIIFPRVGRTFTFPRNWSINDLCSNRKVLDIAQFLVADKRLYKRLCPSVGPSVRRSVGWSVGWSVTLESKSGKTRISAPAHLSATGIGRVSGLVTQTNAFS